MNGSTPDPETQSFPFWPVLLVVLAFNLFLVSQIHTTWRGTTRIKEQREIFANRIRQAEGQLAAARTIMTTLQGLCNDLLDLSKTDSEIRRIVDKYEIRKNQPATPTNPPAEDSTSK